MPAPTGPGYRVLGPDDEDVPLIFASMQRAREMQLLLAELPGDLSDGSQSSGQETPVDFLIVSTAASGASETAQAEPHQHSSTAYVLPISQWQQGLGSSAQLAEVLQAEGQTRVRCPLAVRLVRPGALRRPCVLRICYSYSCSQSYRLGRCQQA